MEEDNFNYKDEVLFKEDYEVRGPHFPIKKETEGIVQQMDNESVLVYIPDTYFGELWVWVLPNIIKLKKPRWI